MKIVFKNLRKKMGYARIVRINEKIAQINEQVADLKGFIEKAKQANLILAATTARQAVYELMVKKGYLEQKRQHILQTVFGGNENEEENY